MRCVVCSMARTVRHQGRPASVVVNYDRFWKRYLLGFDEVVVVGLQFEQEDENARPVEGPGVTMVPVPGFRDPLGMLRHLPAIRRTLEEVYDEESVFILRCPNLLSDLLYRKLRRRGHPYGVELAGDPALTFGPTGNPHPLQPLWQWHFTRWARRECRNACAVAYTSRQQQQRYPAGPGALQTIYSYVTLEEEDFVQEPKRYQGGPLALVAVGSLQRLHKGPDLAIEALAECVREGLDATLTWVGGGRRREEMERLAQKRGVGERVQLVGWVPAGAAVQAHLDVADLYLMPSRAEGLPKALLEAMARGLPCLATAVGSIPDLLDAEDLVPPDDAHALARRIMDVAAAPERMHQMARRNLSVAREYRNEVMDRRRKEFYGYLAERTRDWLRTRRTVRDNKRAGTA